jgi:peroxiredoxin Q/BCP
MPVELRKRPPPKETAAPPPAAKRGSGSALKKLADKAKAAVTGSGSTASKATAETAAPIIPETVTADPAAAKANGGAKGTGKLTVGETIDVDGFGGTVQTHDGTDVTVKDLLEKSGAGVVLFTYPKASTPGCKSFLAGIILFLEIFDTDLLVVQARLKHVSSEITIYPSLAHHWQSMV